MFWKQVKRFIIPLIIVKVIFFLFFIFRSDIVSISRDLTYSPGYYLESDNDSLVLKRQKLIRIVRNEEERGISITLRGKKNSRPSREKDGEIILPVVD
jgi:hypothetical protein